MCVRDSIKVYIRAEWLINVSSLSLVLLQRFIYVVVVYFTCYTFDSSRNYFLYLLLKRLINSVPIHPLSISLLHYHVKFVHSLF
jgi:hypothetical protein